MTDYKQKDVFLSHGKVTKNDKTTVSSKSKTCQAIDECDKNTYTWSYKNDKEDLFNPGSVISDRQWIYGLTKYAAVVQVAVAFRANLTFSFFGSSVERIIRVEDDHGTVHGRFKIEVESSTPYLFTEPVKSKKKRERKRPETESHSTHDISVVEESTSSSSGVDSETTSTLVERRDSSIG